MTKQQIYREVIDDIHSEYQPDDIKNNIYTVNEIVDFAMYDLRSKIDKENNERMATAKVVYGGKSPKFSTIKLNEDEVPSTIVAALIDYFFLVRLVWDASCDIHSDEERDKMILSRYYFDGPNKGLYSIDDSAITALTRLFYPACDDAFVKRVRNILRSQVLIVKLTTDAKYIPLNNGVISYTRDKDDPTKTHIVFDEYDPENYVFFTKSVVDYVEKPAPINIHNDIDGTDWNPIDWMNDYNDNPEVVQLLWQVICASLRFNCSWRKAIYLIGTGANGKSSYASVITNLAGNKYFNISMDGLEEKFALETLPGNHLIYSDENNATYVSKSEMFKKIVDGNKVSIDRKNLTSIMYTPRCVLIQAYNSMPKFKDTSFGASRRYISIPFDKCFEVPGQPNRTYITDDYLKRKEVLEYIVYYVLNELPYFDEFVEPACCDLLKNQISTLNNSVLSWATETLNNVHLDALPLNLAYTHYVKWYEDVYGREGKPKGRNTFIADLEEVLRKDKTLGWCFNRVDKKRQSRNTLALSQPDDFLEEYPLAGWTSEKGDSRNNKVLSKMASKMHCCIYQISYYNENYQRLEGMSSSTANTYDTGDDSVDTAVGTTVNDSLTDIDADTLYAYKEYISDFAVKGVWNVDNLRSVSDFRTNYDKHGSYGFAPERLQSNTSRSLGDSDTIMLLKYSDFINKYITDGARPLKSLPTYDGFKQYYSHTGEYMYKFE